MSVTDWSVMNSRQDDARFEYIRWSPHGFLKVGMGEVGRIFQLKVVGGLIVVLIVVGC